MLAKVSLFRRGAAAAAHVATTGNCRVFATLWAGEAVRTASPVVEKQTTRASLRGQVTGDEVASLFDKDLYLGHRLNPVYRIGSFRA